MSQQQKEQYRPRTQAFSAGQIVQVNTSGQFFHLLSAADKLKVSIDEGSYVEFTQGQGIVSNFRKLRLFSDTAQTVKWLTGAGRFVDSADNVNVTTSATIAPGNTVDNGGDVLLAAVTSGVLSAADLSRLSLIVKADIGNLGIVRVGVAGVGAGNGLPLEAGESVTLATTAAIYAYNTHASLAQNLHVLPIREL